MSLARVSTSLLAKAQQGLGVTGGRPAAALRRFNDRFNDEPSQQAKDKVSDPSTEKLVKQAENEVAEVEKQRLGKDAGDDAWRAESDKSGGGKSSDADVEPTVFGTEAKQQG